MNDPHETPQPVVWPVLLAGMFATLGASLLAMRHETDNMAGWASAASWGTAWLALVRFRFFNFKRRWPWMVVLVIAWLLASLGMAGAFTAVVLTFPFMLRQQHSLRYLTSRRRALVFPLAVVVLAATFVAGLDRPEGGAGDIVLLARLGVQAFWFSAMLTLLVNMRLHFLRLRAKLMVAGVLVGVVPMMLQIAFGALLLYGSLGGVRANGIRALLDSWAETYTTGSVPLPFTAEPVVWDETVEPDSDHWTADMVRKWRVARRNDARRSGVRTDSTFVAQALPDTCVYVTRAFDIWLVRVRDPEPGRARVDALIMDQHAFDTMAKVLRADVELFDWDVRDDWREDQNTVNVEKLSGRFHHDLVDSTASWWDKRWLFGLGLANEVQFSGGRFRTDEQFVVGLRTSVSDLIGEYANEKNPLTTAIMVTLGVLAVLLMGAGVVAYAFSSRITGGITGAVKALHRGTQRLAAGDLDTAIEVANEDEFGDLAHSFNEMTTAVKQGREDALARERLQQEMETARKIQERLLPHDQPLLAGWEVTGVSLPSLQVGGDYFDFVSPGDDLLGVAIGDVSGKGVPAALLMSNLQASLKGQVMHPAPVSDTVSRVNDLLAESTDSNMFATFLYGELHGGSGRFVCTNAGHDPALVVRRDGEVEWLGSSGLILGMFPDQEYSQASVDLTPGDLLVLYTDGITEAGAPTPVEVAALGEDEVEDRQFGEEKLAEVVVAARERSALGVREAVLDAVQEHLGSRPQGDDITLVVIKRGEELAPAREPDPSE